MSKEELMKYYRPIVDVWKYFRKYSAPVDSDEFWKLLVTEGNELSRRHGETDFVCGLVGVAQQEIERICKRRKQNEQAKI